jgi:hypothetical protein
MDWRSTHNTDILFSVMGRVDAANDLTLLSTIVDTLRAHSLDIWVFGGWAEQLKGLRQPGPHADTDLLIRATNFRQLEVVLADIPGVTEIPEKHFSHKRAFEWNGVRVEVFLVQPSSPDTTIMFDGRAAIHWPTDTFAESPVAALHVASKTALRMYRRNHDQVTRAHREFCNARARNTTNLPPRQSQ